jgi:hypothetical protein
MTLMMTVLEHVSSSCITIDVPKRTSVIVTIALLLLLLQIISSNALNRVGRVTAGPLEISEIGIGTWQWVSLS